MNFDEKSGEVPCATPWGRWLQTMDMVYVLVDVPSGTRGREVQCKITPGSLRLVVKGEELFSGEMFGKVMPDESVWTLEDGNLIRIALCKSSQAASNCWRSLLVGQYEADPMTFDEMEKKMTLERFQRENPGFDFSKAAMSGNYHGGGPKLPDSR